MPSKSKAQQRFFGMIYWAKKHHTEDKLTGKAKEVADKLTKRQTKDFAETKTSDLPGTTQETKKQEYNRKVASALWQECIRLFSSDY